MGPARGSGEHVEALATDHLRGVLDNEGEGGDARGAEGGALDGDEDVAVEGDVLDGLVHAPEAALCALERDLEQQVGVLHTR